jgi:hypothetical protein
VVHQNFEPANVLLGNEFSVRVAECGLSVLMLSSSVTQVTSSIRYKPVLRMVQPFLDTNISKLLIKTSEICLFT